MNKTGWAATVQGKWLSSGFPILVKLSHWLILVTQNTISRNVIKKGATRHSTVREARSYKFSLHVNCKMDALPLLCPRRWRASLTLWTHFSLSSVQILAFFQYKSPHRPPGITSNFSARAFSVSAPSTWNSLPEHIRSVDTLSTFKRHLKFHLFQSWLFEVLCVCTYVCNGQIKHETQQPIYYRFSSPVCRQDRPSCSRARAAIAEAAVDKSW